MAVLAASSRALFLSFYTIFTWSCSLANTMKNKFTRSERLVTFNTHTCSAVFNFFFFFFSNNLPLFNIILITKFFYSIVCISKFNCNLFYIFFILILINSLLFQKYKTLIYLIKSNDSFEKNIEKL
jgi:hypothetical protein